MSNKDDPIFGAIFGVGLGIYFFFDGFKKLKRKRLMENTPTSKVRALAMGLCEVYGETKTGPAGLIKSPFAGEDCLYYNYEIEKYKNAGKDSEWVTVRTGGYCVPFLLRDETGEVLVNPTDADADISSDHVFTSGNGEKPNGLIAAFLKQQNLSSTDLFGWDKRMRYTESVIRPGENLYVLGTAMDNPHVEEASAEQGCLDVMISSSKGSFFYLSDRSEKACLGELSLTVLLEIWGGAALTLACLAYIFYRAGLFN